MTPQSQPGSSSAEVHAVAIQGCREGLSMLPPMEDGSKRPAGHGWGEYQSTRLTEAELNRWFSEPHTGIGVVTGEISGNLELLEFDDYQTYLAFKERATAVGLSDLVERVETGYEETTPGDGIHWLYRCPDGIGPNTKLASRPAPSPENDHGVKVLIETRGEGGWVIIAPSFGGVHPTGKPYRLLRGSLGSIVTISGDEREMLFELARSFDEMPVAAASVFGTTGSGPAGDGRPGDEFNKTATWDDVLDGWSNVYTDGTTTYWRRPGKSTGISATTNYGDSDLLYVFSTSTEFEALRSYDKFGAYTVLDHGGDFVAAAASLRPAGSGPPPAAGLHQTDLGNAERFVQQHGHRLRYVRPWKRWMVWDGTRWRPDTTGEAERAAKATVRTIYAEASSATTTTERKALAKHATKSESDHAIKALLVQASTESEVAMSPEAFDMDSGLFNCLNGTIDLETGELYAHDPVDFITKIAQVEYDPYAVDTAWDDFLYKATGGDDDLERFLQDAIGYSLTGNTGEEKLFFVHGQAATGKSTFLESIKGVFGDYAMTADFSTFLAKQTGVRNDIARLRGARFVISIEVDDGQRLAESTVKSMVGGDTVTARMLYQEAFEFRPQFKLWLAANNAPGVRASDEGMWRRILRVPFDQTVPEADRNPELKQYLTTDPAARSAILAWAVRGCLEWQQSGLCVPECVRIATREYRAGSNPLTAFLDESCVLGPGKQVAAATFRDAYYGWALDNQDAENVPRGKVLELLRPHGVEEGKGAGGKRIYLGVALRHAA